MSITLDGDNLATVGVPNSGTAQATTSGTIKTFTGIPAGVKRITIMLNGVSTNGSSNLQIQVGGGTPTYSSSGWTTNTNNANSTAGLLITGSNLNTYAWSGNAQLCNVSGNIWSFSAVTGHQGASAIALGGGVVSITGTLSSVIITTVNGTDTFDAGSVNIFWE